MNNNIQKFGKNVAQSVLSQIPIVSAFSKFVEDYVQDNWQERIDLWKEEVVKKFSELDVEFEQKIRETSNFSSILASAQRGALEDMEKDKVSLYINAVINSIKNENIDDVEKHIFLNYLRKYSIAHIKILYFIENQKEYIDSHPEIVKEDIKYTYTSFKQNNYPLILYPGIISNFCESIKLDLHFWDLIVLELYNDKMIRVETFWDSFNHPNKQDFKSATYLGRKFLDFIK